MKKKNTTHPQDKKDWEHFVSKMDGVFEKEEDKYKTNHQERNFKKLDLHGYSLSEANKITKNFILDSFNIGIRELLIITGKGARSKSSKDPYISEKLSVLKYSIPEYISRDDDLKNIVIKIKEADFNKGGEGALSIFLKKNSL